MVSFALVLFCLLRCIFIVCYVSQSSLFVLWCVCIVCFVRLLCFLGLCCLYSTVHTVLSVLLVEPCTPVLNLTTHAQVPWHAKFLNYKNVLRSRCDSKRVLNRFTIRLDILHVLCAKKDRNFLTPFFKKWQGGRSRVARSGNNKVVRCF